MAQRAVDPLLRDAILAWYRSNGRSFPFRGSTDPYAILVSEAMSQQTQAARAGEGWIRFLGSFPTVEALASASPGDVLRAWRGLGYNSRALNLRRAAERIVTEFGGIVPADIASLESLPGVGPYTARAIAAFAFGLPVGAVDTNVRRVLGRISVGRPDRLGRADMQRLADAFVPVSRAAAWTHALMDIGATVCRPRRPSCSVCPAKPWCAYAQAPAAGVWAEPAPLDAQPDGSSREARVTVVPFPATSRWLRGRIVDRLRDAPAGEWVVIVPPLGEHDGSAIEVAVRGLARGGLLEIDDRRSQSPLRVRLPIR